MLDFSQHSDEELSHLEESVYAKFREIDGATEDGHYEALLDAIHEEQQRREDQPALSGMRRWLPLFLAFAAGFATAILVLLP